MAKKSKRSRVECEKEKEKKAKKRRGRRRKKWKFETRQKKIEFRTDLSLSLFPSLAILEIVSARVWLCKRSFDVHQCIECLGG